MTTKYEWAPGSRVRADAQAVGTELARYRATTAEAVLARARQCDSALHTAFEWDDGVAAHQHRLLQARQVLGSLRRVVVHVESHEPEQRRVFVAVAANDADQRYVRIDRLHADEHEALLGQLKRELLAWAGRNAEFREHAELAPVFRAIRRLSDPIAEAAE